jgi:hypothetical protein
MARISYNDISDSKVFAIRVTMDGRMQGFIRQQEEGGYYFARKGSRGETFPSVDEVKRSLEAE